MSKLRINSSSLVNSSEIVVPVAEIMHKQAIQQHLGYNKRGRNSSGIVLRIRTVQTPLDTETLNMPGRCDHGLVIWKRNSREEAPCDFTKQHEWKVTETPHKSAAALGSNLMFYIQKFT